MKGMIMATTEAEHPVQQLSWLAWAKEPETSLGPLLACFEQDDETEFVKTLGPPEKPHTAVVKMSVDTARRYQEQFQGEYFFEENAPLHPQEDAS